MFVLASVGAVLEQSPQAGWSIEAAVVQCAVPVVDNATDEPAPLLVAIHGPPGVGKTTLIRCLIKHYTRQSVGELRGPVTVVSSKKRRITFVECPNDICGMIDVAKAADVVLLLVDGEFGFEMETFEFLMLLQQHGMPKVIGVLNHLDGFKDNKKLKKVKKELKNRFDVEVSHGSKLFYLSGIRHGKYLKREVLNLARFISTAKTRPITWRLSHPYLLADRFEVLSCHTILLDGFFVVLWRVPRAHVTGCRLQPLHSELPAT